MAGIQARSLDRLFHALSDPNRRGMVDQLARGPASVKELAEPQALALPSALKHLKVLEEGGLVRSQKSGRVRTYRLEAEALQRVEAWVAARKDALNHQFDRLEAYLAGAGAEAKEGGAE
ncbi:helix-turn-helix transcriptional regulator [Nitratireductor sp. ZSWI3]|uniref:ArsR/SmtB family transcription factor n=1 Tax=Nitratireductor sp. ZSWI3 TaxID=2966359 RepID=UPI002150410B|nr:metalloregulator ArsR/SmtB family transcription factor [Nitratireductor sp. ZSWI3]MCR4269055.1 metalloregulator ArsR/SmtB family transcription factor [Nitratireductor sp. ZSWI3]